MPFRNFISVRKLKKKVVEAMYTAVIREIGQRSLTPAQQRDRSYLRNKLGGWSATDRYFYDQLMRRMEKQGRPKAAPLYGMKGDFISIIRRLKKIKAHQTLKRTLELRKQGKI